MHAPALLLLGFLSLQAASCAALPDPKFRVTGIGDGLVIAVDGELLTEYRFANAPKPVLYPLFAPGGGALTRAWPLDEAAMAPGEERDHPHHQSLWFAHGDVNGHDFWSGRDGASIVHTRFKSVRTDGRGVRTRSTNEWRAGGGVVLTEERAMHFAGGAGVRTIDFEFVLVASHGPVTLGDTKEGTFALRLAPTLRLKGAVARGTARNSEGASGKDVWGRRARWVAYEGPLTAVEGTAAAAPVCVAIFDHPANPRHPTWWHARDYGLFAANPFGAHDFEGAPAGTGDLHLEPGERLPLRYRLWIHSGSAGDAALERAFAEYAATDGSARRR